MLYFLYDRAAKFHYDRAGTVVGFAPIHAVYDKMILSIKVHVISTLAGLVVEARYVVQDSGLNSVLKLYI